MAITYLIVGVIMGLIVGTALGYSLAPKKEPFQPNLINLKKYEAGLYYARQYNEPLLRVMPIPNTTPVWGTGAGWTDSELQYMRNNRAEAQKIYNRVWEE